MNENENKNAYRRAILEILRKELQADASVIKNIENKLYHASCEELRVIYNAFAKFGVKEVLAAV